MRQKIFPYWLLAIARLAINIPRLAITVARLATAITW